MMPPPPPPDDPVQDTPIRDEGVPSGPHASAPARASAALELLRGFSHASNLRMARESGIDASIRKGTALIARLADQFFEPAAISSRLVALEPNERAVFDLIVLTGGKVLVSVVRQRLEAEDAIDPEPARSFWDHPQPIRGDADKRGSRKLEDILARLAVNGLAFPHEPARTDKVDILVPGRYVVIPEPVLRRVPSGCPPVPFPVEIAGSPDIVRAGDPELFVRNLYVLSSFAIEAPIPLGATGLIPKRTLALLHDVLPTPENVKEARSEADLGRFRLLRTLAEDMGLLRRGSGGLRLTDTAPTFFADSPGQRYRRCYDAYARSTEWSELSRLRQLTLSPKTGLSGPILSVARKRVLTELAELPADQWIPIDHFVDRMRLRQYEFLFSRTWQAAGYAYYHGIYAYRDSNPYGGQNPLGVSFDTNSASEVDWDDVEGGFIRTVVTEALHWLGLVDLAYATAENAAPDSFRLTGIGAALFRGEMPGPPWVPPADRANVVIQPNFQILSFEPTGPATLLMLDRLARRVRLDLVVEHHLTRDSVYAAQRAGLSIGEIVRFLEEVSTAPLPQNVRRSLEDWGTQLDRVVVRRGVALIQTANEVILDALCADDAIAPLLARRVGPRAALVPWQHLDAVRSCLVEGKTASGVLLPALSEGNDAYDNPEIVCRGDGRIEFQRQVPSMYAQQALRAFSEERTDGSWWLTPASLRKGARTAPGPDDTQRVTQVVTQMMPLQAEGIIATLGTLHAGPLPDEVASLVKRWGKNWGTGTLDNLDLLLVDSEAIMQDLLADHELRANLKPLPGAPLYAVISTGKAEEVRKLLAERGMELRDGVAHTPS